MTVQKGSTSESNVKRRKFNFKNNQNNNASSNNMDILKKFRYNFHYWLRNCYQNEDFLNEQQ